MKHKTIVKPEPGLVVRLPFTGAERTEYKKHITERHIVAGRWIAELVLADIRAHK